METHITSENWLEILKANIGSSNMGNIRKALYKRSDLHCLIEEATSFCPKETAVPIRLNYLVSGLNTVNTCKECKIEINDGKKSFCSHSCRAKATARNPKSLKKKSASLSASYLEKTDDERQSIKENRKKTMLSRYGVSHNFNIDGFHEKRSSTWKDRYGDSVAQRSESVKEKARMTCQNRYGGNNPLSDPAVKAKWLSSYKQNHGVNNPMHNDSVKRKCLASRLNIPTEEVMFLYEKLVNKEELNSYEYTLFVRILTESTLQEYGVAKFGQGWDEKRGKYAKHIDHSVSIRTGFINNIDPNIISNIENLELIDYQKNLSKGSKDAFTIQELYNKINKSTHA